jgi:AcrR family transcriptional regulator
MAVTEDAAAGAARPLRRDAQRNRERIIAAAREVFATRGFAATLDDVAHHAGVGVGTVYRRFPTKEALVQALFADRLADVIALGEQALAEPSAWDGLVLLLTRSARMHAADRGLRDAVLSVGKLHLAELKDRITTLAGQVVDRAKAEGTLRPDVEQTDIPIILAMVSEVAGCSPGTRPDAYERYLTLIIDGLRARPGSGDLGRPLDQSDVIAFITACVPAIAGRRP